MIWGEVRAGTKIRIDSPTAPSITACQSVPEAQLVYLSLTFTRKNEGCEKDGKAGKCGKENLFEDFKRARPKSIAVT